MRDRRVSRFLEPMPRHGLEVTTDTIHRNLSMTAELKREQGSKVYLKLE